MAKLLDVNLAVVILHAEHEHAPIARTWLAQQSEPASLFLCLVVQMGVLRLLMRRAMMGSRVLNAEDAWQYWRTLLTDERFCSIAEPDGIEEAWHNLAAQHSVRACFDTDTDLAAFALAGDHTLATFDKGFARFTGLKTETLTQQKIISERCKGMIPPSRSLRTLRDRV